MDPALGAGSLGGRVGVIIRDDVDGVGVVTRDSEDVDIIVVAVIAPVATNNEDIAEDRMWSNSSRAAWPTAAAGSV